MALSAFKLEMGDYPSTDQGLSALLINPVKTQDSKRWKGPYLEQLGTEVPIDPWRNPYIYAYPGLKNPNGYDLYSAGPYGQPVTGADIIQ